MHTKTKRTFFLKHSTIITNITQKPNPEEGKTPHNKIPKTKIKHPYTKITQERKNPPNEKSQTRGKGINQFESN